jgi:splicing factor 3A subunit 1
MDTPNGNTPVSEDMNKPPEGLVLPPKDIRGSSLFLSAQRSS